MHLISGLFTITLSLFFFLIPLSSYAKQDVLNIYAWAGEIPESIVREFEQETQIKVNLSTYENNEIMYAKLRATRYPVYDIVMPSSYFVDRMRRQNLLQPLELEKLPHLRHLNPLFRHPAYDPSLQFSVPYIWGITGIFVNDQYYPPQSIKKWKDLWKKKYKDQLMLLDDTREVFSMALLALGYPANDTNPQHIKEAFLKLKVLMKNIKVFSSETVVSVMIDEDAVLGMAWNGDAYKASLENPHIHFIFPEEGFVIWVDNFAIPLHAPHKEAAYQFIDFILRPDIAKKAALATRFPTTNLSAQRLLPATIRNNKTAYPPEKILRHGQFQIDLGPQILSLYEHYWEILKVEE